MFVSTLVKVTACETRNATSDKDRFLESREGVNGKDLIVNADRRHIYLIADFGLDITCKLIHLSLYFMFLL